MSNPVLIIEDFSALGQISSTGALTVLQAMGHTTATIPATILSSQTEGFGIPAMLTPNTWIEQTFHHWQSQHIEFDGALIGYLGQINLVQQISTYLSEMNHSLVVIDPVMGDRGELYPGFDQDYVDAVLDLCRQADLITPNWTELNLLTNQPMETPTAPAINKRLQVLQKRSINAGVIITGVEQGDQVGCLWWEDDQLNFCGNPKQAGHFYGTGDIFAALLYGRLLQGWDKKHVIKAAISAMEQAIMQTAPLPESQRRFGLKLNHLMQTVISQNEE